MGTNDTFSVHILYRNARLAARHYTSSIIRFALYVQNVVRSNKMMGNWGLVDTTVVLKHFITLTQSERDELTSRVLRHSINHVTIEQIIYPR